MRILLVVVALFVLLLLLGCHGESRHDVTTGLNGTLDGLVLTPDPQSLGLPTDTEFLLDWKTGYAPPSTFQVSLKKIDPNGTTGAVLTELDTLSVGHYRLCPTSNLSSQTFYLLQVTGAGQSVRAIYLTGGVALQLGAPAATRGGEATHIVTVR